MPFGLCGVVGFTLMHRGRGWVHPGLLGSPGSALLGVGFMRGRWVHPKWHSGTPWGSLGSSGVVGFPRIRPVGGCVHPCPLGSLACALGVVAFIRGRWVHSGATRGSLRSSVVVGFTRVHPGVFEFILGH